MMRNFFKFFILALFCSIVFQWGCLPEKPLQPDSGLSARVVVIDTTGLYDPTDTTRHTPVANAEVVLNSKDYDLIYRVVTNQNGVVDVDKLVASAYEVNAKYPLNPGTLLIGGDVMSVFSPQPTVDTVYLTAISPAPIVINEIYYCGPVNNVYFFFDQFIELFNRTDSTVYLDGMILARCRTSPEIQPIIDSVDYVQTVYTYQFPGTPGGHEYPVEPGEFVVVASDAADHSQSLPNAIDLHDADFEFYNQYSGDYDNLDVPNLLNLNPTKTADFLIALTSDAVVLADGTEWELVTVSTSTGDKVYINLPIRTIVDGVEYKSSTAYQKGLTYRIDAGYTGIGVTRYSGKSVERIDPYVDTNNSTVDFRILDHPTPGYKAP